MGPIFRKIKKKTNSLNTKFALNNLLDSHVYLFEEMEFVLAIAIGLRPKILVY